MVYENVKYSPALLKLFDEILMNAVDHKLVDNDLNKIKIEINKERKYKYL